MGVGSTYWLDLILHWKKLKNNFCRDVEKMKIVSYQFIDHHKLPTRKNKFLGNLCDFLHKKNLFIYLTLFNKLFFHLRNLSLLFTFISIFIYFFINHQHKTQPSGKYENISKLVNTILVLNKCLIKFFDRFIIIN